MSHGYGKHLLIMLACCLIPLALILGVSMFGLTFGSLTPLIPYVLALMCPLMMLAMMWGMARDHNASAQHHHDDPLGKSDGHENKRRNIGMGKLPLEH